MPETLQNRQVQSIMFHIMPSAQADKPSVPFSNCGHQILKILAIENGWPWFECWKTQGIESCIMLVSTKSCTRPLYPPITRGMLENGRGHTLERTLRLEEPSPLVKARVEIDDTSLRPLQCHCKKQAKPKEKLRSPLLSKPC